MQESAYIIVGAENELSKLVHHHSTLFAGTTLLAYPQNGLSPGDSGQLRNLFPEKTRLYK